MIPDQQGGFTGTLAELLKQAINHELTEFHVCMPGKIETYDSSDNTATVKPTISRRMRGAAEPIEYPVIPKVPVVQPRTAKARINFPIESGDPVLLVFADRNIENWLQSRGDAPREVRDLRRHDLSDGFAILGGYPFEVPAPPKFPGALNIEVEPGTKIAFTNGSVELLDIMDQMTAVLEDVTNGMITALTAHIHSSAGAGPPTVPFTSFQVQLTLLKAKLKQLKA